MHLRKSKTLSFLVALVMAFSVFVTYAPTASAVIYEKSLSVPIKTQQYSNWCWAGCAEMVGKYINPGASRSQSAIVSYVKGHPINEGANVNETASASRYASHEKKYFSSQFTLGGTNWSYSTIRSRIDANTPVIMLAGRYSGATRIGGHFVVCYGYTQNTIYNYNLIRYQDPSNGTKYVCEFAAFKDGSFNGRKYDGTVWYS